MAKTKTTKKIEKSTEVVKDKKISDEEYWNQYGIHSDDEDNYGWNGHDIELDFDITFKGRNGTIFQTVEKSVNAANLNEWFSSLKKLVRLVDEDKQENTWDEFCGF